MAMTFQLKQDNFEGPLEVLLELIEKEKMSISEISLAKVTDDYLRHIKSLFAIDPEQLAEFLVVAAQLMLIKSRSLLPDLELPPEEEGSAEELARRLEEYRKIREAIREIKKMEETSSFIFTREAYQDLAPVFYPPADVTAFSLRDCFTSFLASLPKLEKLAEDKIKKIISLEEKIKNIRNFLQGTVQRAFSEIIKGSKEKMEVIVSFLAVLELAKQKFLSLEQEKLFAEIKVKKET